MSVPTTPRPFTRRVLARAGRSALILPIAALLATTACSSGSTSDGGSGSGGPSSTEAVATATKLLDEAAASAVTGPAYGDVTPDKIVPWTADLMPKIAALPKDKKISVTIVYGLSVGEGPYLANLTAAIAQKLGWETKIIRAEGQSQATTLSAFQQAVNDKPTAIIALVVPGVWVGGALEDAKKKGIFTVNVHQDSSTGKGYDAWVPAAESIQKSLLGAYAVKDSKGKASSLLIDAPGFSDSAMPAAQKYLTSTCGGCTTKAKQINPLDLIDPVKLQGNVTALLASNPGVKYLVWPSAALPVQPVVTAIRASASKDAQLLVNGMGPAPVGLVKQGGTPLLVQIPDALLSLAAIDNVSRLVQGQPAVAEADLRLPVSYWTQKTAPDAKDFATITEAQLSNDFLAPYDEAWGTSLRDTILGITK